MSYFHDQKLGHLRAEIRKMDAYGFVVPRTDCHQGEYIADHDERLAWLSGFKGSAGLAVITLNSAALFIDGRYTIQASRQVSHTAYQILNIGHASPYEWARYAFKKDQTLLLDPWLHTEREVILWQDVMASVDGKVEFTKNNPIDAIWENQPDLPHQPVWVHAYEFHNTTIEEKIAVVWNALTEHRADAVILSAPDSIAWLLNIRGSDIVHTPVPLAFAIVAKDKPIELFIGKARITASVKAHFDDKVMVYEHDELPERLKEYAGKAVMIDHGATPYHFIQFLEGISASIIRAEDPCIFPKAIKNSREQQGMRECHARDGAAVTRLLAWLDDVWPDNKLSELSIAEKLLEFRKEGEYFLEPSFTTIAAVGANAAIVHYSPTKVTDYPLANDVIFLLDSGGQYLDGTTDITRTFIIGKPTNEHRSRFTQVLKGHIALARAIFPRGTNGAQLDTLARMPLWQQGIDFDHGTGHGVGYCLSVHEGPQRISKAGYTPLVPGMVLSNEPGYYKHNEFGVRIESLILVKEHESFKNKKDEPMLCFETLTKCPIDRKLIDTDVLNHEEIAWVNAYHEDVARALEPYLDSSARQWLQQATQPLK